MDNMLGVVFWCLLDENWSMLFISFSVLDLMGYSFDEFVLGWINFE